MTWRETYASKLVSIDEAARLIESGDRIFMPPGCGAPVRLIDAVAEVPGIADVQVVGGLLLQPLKIFKEPQYFERFTYHSFFLGPVEAKFVNAGNVRPNSINYSSVVRALREVYRPTVLLTEVSPPDDDGYLYFGPMGVPIDGEVASYATKVIVQVNRHQPRSNGVDNKIHVDDAMAICEFDHPLPELPQPEVTERDRQIASHIVPLIKDGSCLQVGLGGLANAITYSLETKKGLSIHSEMISDSVVHLARIGVVTGKVYGACAFGNKETYDFTEDPRVELDLISTVNDPVNIGTNDNMVSINACLMVDLTGQVGAESVGFTQYASVGGQLDFVRGAALSKGGQSFICVNSTYRDSRGDERSTLMLSLPPGTVVTTPKSDVMNVVTEYGVAQLFNRPLEDRVRALIAIAHPDFRESLERDAIEVGLLHP